MNIEIELDSKIDKLKEKVEEASIEEDKYKISGKNRLYKLAEIGISILRYLYLVD